MNDGNKNKIVSKKEKTFSSISGFLKSMNVNQSRTKHDLTCNFQTENNLKHFITTHMLFAYDINDKGGKQYFALPKTTKKELNVIRTLLKTDFHLYELISDSIPIKFYFDLEIKGTERYDNYPHTKENVKTSQGMFNQDIITLKLALVIIENCFQKYYGLPLLRTSICILHSCRQSKLSFHVIIKDTYCAVNIHEAGNFAKYVSNTICELVQSDDKYICLIGGNTTIVDTTVYKTDQLMRLKNQSKRKIDGENSGTLDAITKILIDDPEITLLNNSNFKALHNSNIPTVILPNKPDSIKITNNKNQQPQPQTQQPQTQTQELPIIDINSRFISDTMIATTGTCLKDEMNMTDSEWFKLPEYLMCLYIIRVQHSYHVWFAIGVAIINSGGSIDDFKKFSQMNKTQYVAEEEQRILDIGKREKSFKLGTLYHFARVSNLTCYEKIKNHIVSTCLNPNLNEINVITENTRFLSTNPDGTFNNNIFTNDKFLAFKSPCGSGKSVQIERIKKHYNYETCLCITPRISFAKFISTYFNIGFYKDDKIDVRTCNNLAIQLESLMKIPYNKVYKLIIIDESESLLKQFSSTTMTGKVAEIFNKLCSIITKAEKVIIADAYISERSIDFCKMFTVNNENNDNTSNNSGITLIENVFVKENKLKAIQVNDCDIVEKLKDDLKNGLNLYLCVCSKAVSDRVYKEILDENILIDSQILYYHSESKADVLETLNKVNDTWKDKRLIIVTPKVTCGISFSDPDVKHFHRTYCITTNLSCVVLDVMQQIARVRELKDNTMFFSVKRNTHFYGMDCIVNSMEFNANKELALRELANEYLNSLDTASEKYKTKRELFDNLIANEHLIKLLLYNTKEQKLSRMNFFHIFVEFMKKSHFDITLLDTMKPDESIIKINDNDEVSNETHLANFNAIANISNETFNQNKILIDTHCLTDDSKAKTENSKYIFMTHIKHDAELIDVSVLYFKVWKTKPHIITNVYYEMNKLPSKMAYKEIIKHEGLYSLCDTTPLKIQHILELNKCLGLDGSYDVTTKITKNNLLLATEYIFNNWNGIQGAFTYAKTKVLPIETENDDKFEKAKNQFVYYAINGLYKEFNGNSMNIINKCSIHRNNRDRKVYMFDGIDLGNIIKKILPRLPNYDEILDKP